jgi:hypothetical protein
MSEFFHFQVQQYRFFTGVGMRLAGRVERCPWGLTSKVKSAYQALDLLAAQAEMAGYEIVLFSPISHENSVAPRVELWVSL